MMKKEMEKGTNNDDSVKKTPPVKSLKDLKGFLKNLKTN
jgi:hypothetical protein